MGAAVLMIFSLSGAAVYCSSGAAADVMPAAGRDTTFIQDT
jgi:hypothetical protein